MREVLKLFAQILLLRRGPQDLPASRLLLALTVAAYVGVNGLIASVFPPARNWPALLVVDTGFLLLWNVLLLRLAGRPERAVQTVTAVFGYQLPLAPPLVALQWLAQRLHGDATWEGPVMLVWLGLLAWLVVANGKIVSAALEWSFPAGLTLVIVQVIADDLLQSMILVPFKG